MNMRQISTVCLLAFLFCAASVDRAPAFDELSREPIYYSFDLDGKPAPKRMVSRVASDRPLPIENEFIAKLYSFYSTNRYDCDPLENREKLLVSIARGDYKTAIQEAEKELKRTFSTPGAFAADAKSGTLFRKRLFILATAHELNGDWREALSLFAILEGDDSVDFMFTEARILFATGNREKAFQLVCDAQKRIEPLPVDSVMEKIQREIQRSRRTSENAPFTLGGDLLGAYDSEWFELWKLRELCARIVRPELHFVATHPFWLPPLQPQGGKTFAELQRESYEAFLKFVDEENARSDLKKKRTSEVNLFHKLEEIPYGCGFTGMPGVRARP